MKKYFKKFTVLVKNMIMGVIKKGTPASQVQTHQSRSDFPDQACMSCYKTTSKSSSWSLFVSRFRESISYSWICCMCHVSCSTVDLIKFQSIFNPCNQLQKTTGNDINIKLQSDITKLDRFFQNSTDTKKVSAFLKRQQIA